MAIEMTKREVLDTFNCVSVHYCDLQNILGSCSADVAFKIGYTCGVYGWNASVYVLNHRTAIVTGYRPFGTFKVSEDIRKIEHEIGTIRNFEERRAKADEAIKAIIAEVDEEIRRRFN